MSCTCAHFVRDEAGNIIPEVVEHSRLEDLNVDVEGQEEDAVGGTQAQVDELETPESQGHTFDVGQSDIVLNGQLSQVLHELMSGRQCLGSQAKRGTAPTELPYLSPQFHVHNIGTNSRTDSL